MTPSLFEYHENSDKFFIGEQLDDDFTKELLKQPNIKKFPKNITLCDSYWICFNNPDENNTFFGIFKNKLHYIINWRIVNCPILNKPIITELFSWEKYSLYPQLPIHYFMETQFIKTKTLLISNKFFKHDFNRISNDILNFYIQFPNYFLYSLENNSYVYLKPNINEKNVIYYEELLEERTFLLTTEKL